MIKRWLPFALFGLSVLLLLWLRLPNVFTVIALAILWAKLLGSSASPPPRYGPKSVAVIVTVYNEGAEELKECIRRIAAQTWRPDWVVLADDASSSREAVYAGEVLAHQLGLNCLVRIHERNQGKRQAIATAVRATPDAEVYMTVDSDTFINEGAVEALVSRIGHGTTAVTGAVVVANRSRNLLTRVQDVLYSTAFSVGRASQSSVGSVLVCSGAISAYKGSVVRKHLDEFVTQSFAGRPVLNGDDRRLTSFALRYGRVVYAPEAIAATLVPHRPRAWLRQQVRWSRSWMRESYLTMVEQPFLRPAMWLAGLDLFVWILFSVALLLSLAFGLRDNLLYLLGGYLLAGACTMPARAARYLTERTDLSLRQRFAGLLVFPFYTCLYLVVGVPIRLWATATMRDSTWGSRAAPSMSILKISDT